MSVLIAEYIPGTDVLLFVLIAAELYYIEHHRSFTSFIFCVEAKLEKRCMYLAKLTNEKMN